jgi:2-methylcitrate synthase/citrate synthase II
MADYSPGLEGVIAGETAICTLGEDGLRYRGYGIADLAARCSFEEVAYLLLHDDLPTPAELAGFTAALTAERALPAVLTDLARRIPAHAPPMDALRSAVSFAAHFDPDQGDDSPAANRRKAIRLLARVPALLGAWHAAREGRPAPAPAAGGAHAGYLLEQLTGAPAEPAAQQAMNVSLILYAEHEFNASTFAARVTVSSLSDLYSGVVSAIGTLKGPLHGGANEAAMRMLLEVGEPARAESWVLERLERREKIMGFGHRVVRQGDARVPILYAAGAALARARGDTRWMETADVIQATVEREKGLKPNVDFPCAWVYYLLGLPVDLYTPIFVAARVAGWSAHIMEQLANNRIMRPRALYVGRAAVPAGSSASGIER